MKFPTTVTLPLSVFLGAAVTALATVPTEKLMSWDTAKPAVVGAIVAGVAAVIHWLQPAPGGA